MEDRIVIPIGSITYNYRLSYFDPLNRKAVRQTAETLSDFLDTRDVLNLFRDSRGFNFEGRSYTFQQIFVSSFSIEHGSINSKLSLKAIVTVAGLIATYPNVSEGARKIFEDLTSFPMFGIMGAPSRKGRLPAPHSYKIDPIDADSLKEEIRKRDTRND